MKKNFLFLASPNIGIFESWGPVLEYLLKDKNIYTIFSNFDIIFRQVNRNHASVNILSNSLNKIIFKTPIGNWYLASNIYIFENSLFKKIPEFIFYKVYKKLKFIPFFRNFEIFLYSFIYQAKHINDINIYILNQNFEFLAYDVLEQFKKIHGEWLLKININKISFETGINFHVYNKLLKNGNFKNRLNLNYMSNSFGLSSINLPRIKKLKILLVSSQNIDYYKNLYGVNDNDIAVIGIPKHANKWKENILKKTGYFNPYFKDDYLFVISRPAQEYFLPISRKKTYIKYIRDVAYKNNLKIVIKLHPKESLYHGKKIFYDILGKDNFNIKWQFTDKNIYQVALKSKICIGFFTSACIDLIKFNIPCIEILNLSGINEEDNAYSLRDKQNIPVFPYRYFGLVLGVSNYNELDTIVADLLINKEKYMMYLNKNYRKNLKNPNNFKKELSKTGFFT